MSPFIITFAALLVVSMIIFYKEKSDLDKNREISENNTKENQIVAGTVCVIPSLVIPNSVLFRREDEKITMKCKTEEKAWASLAGKESSACKFGQDAKPEEIKEKKLNYMLQLDYNCVGRLKMSIRSVHQIWNKPHIICKKQVYFGTPSLKKPRYFTHTHENDLNVLHFDCPADKHQDFPIDMTITNCNTFDREIVRMTYLICKSYQSEETDLLDDMRHKYVEDFVAIVERKSASDASSEIMHKPIQAHNQAAVPPPAKTDTGESDETKTPPPPEESQEVGNEATTKDSQKKGGFFGKVKSWVPNKFRRKKHRKEEEEDEDE